MVRSFSQNITTFVRKTGLAADKVVRRVGFDAYAGVLLRSPVRTGRFRASNRISINRVDPSVESDRAAPSSQKHGDPLDGHEKSQGDQTVLRAKFGDSIYISNNLPYAKALESGTSPQAPNGPNAIYGLTFDEVKANFERTVRSVTGA